MAKIVKFTGKLRQVVIDKAKWESRLNAILEREIKRAATVWLNTAVLLVIPVWSGASHATFLKLARAVGAPLSITGIKVTNSENSRAVGPRIGFQQSEGKVSSVSNGKVSFTYGTTLFHLVFNEFNDANQDPVAGRLFSRLIEPGPYNFQEAGRSAFEGYARTAIELPSPWRHVKTPILRI